MTFLTSNPAADVDEPNLAPLHVEFQGAFNAVVARGVPLAPAAEALLTIAVAAKCGSDGGRETARQLFLVAAYMTHEADQEEKSSRQASKH